MDPEGIMTNFELSVWARRRLARRGPAHHVSRASTWHLF